jgi:hypothetical protein
VHVRPSRIWEYVINIAKTSNQRATHRTLVTIGTVPRHHNAVIVSRGATDRTSQGKYRRVVLKIAKSLPSVKPLSDLRVVLREFIPINTCACAALYESNFEVLSGLSLGVSDLYVDQSIHRWSFGRSLVPDVTLSRCGYQRPWL